ncbi:T-cell immunoglobulin and mucin domain-containing protein 4-like [Betta splendens]|uniref:T-cell immunoglobulin and mucin domain-containing protein 4-like n=1 Tax=Betta splendens TaxID=158456 RepID=UPI0010F57B16|nr:T-cell immunoglobulin and mucin domain-containing protein 4-like [Betta splendens]
MRVERPSHPHPRTSLYNSLHMRGLGYFLLSILTQGCSGAAAVTGLVGHNVTLFCRYDSQAQGVLSFCWGRAPVPRSKCSDTILSSKDGAVQFRQAARYQALGAAAGDASLTILNAQRSDAGTYGCRVEVPGWFNDYKLDTQLLMEEVEVVTEGDPVFTETSTSALQSPVDADPGHIILEQVTSEDKLNDFLDVGNISKMGLIFIITLIIIASVLWRRFKRQRSLQHPSASTAENIYECPIA